MRWRICYQAWSNKIDWGAGLIGRTVESLQPINQEYTTLLDTQNNNIELIISLYIISIVYVVHNTLLINLTIIRVCRSTMNWGLKVRNEQYWLFRFAHFGKKQPQAAYQTMAALFTLNYMPKKDKIHFTANCRHGVNDKHRKVTLEEILK